MDTERIYNLCKEVCQKKKMPIHYLNSKGEWQIRTAIGRKKFNEKPSFFAWEVYSNPQHGLMERRCMRHLNQLVREGRLDVETFQLHREQHTVYVLL